jgi:uncharacterized protein YcnI
MRIRKLALSTAAIVFAAGGAFAHITLEQQEAVVGSTYKATFRVGHGCDGAATTTIRVQIPEGFIAVKPMPKEGWKLDLVVSDYEKPYKTFEETLTKGVREVTWSGGKLLDAWYDEFVLRGTLAGGEAGTVVYFPIVQQCEKGVHRWIEIPAAGKKADDYKEPAPGLRLINKR